MAQVPKYFIKTNLSEKQIEADVAAFFGWCTPKGMTPFRLLDVDELSTGADKKYKGAIAIYMQFKKSEGLQSVRNVMPSTRQNRSPLEAIREFRHQNDLGDEPTLFFQLREKAKTAADLQHNVLLSYEKPDHSRAIYVAPLLLDSNAYNDRLFDSSCRYMYDPFFWKYSGIHIEDWSRHLRTVPFLRAHVSIPPHERVKSHKHYYAYSESGCDISWHSPSIVDEGPSRLSDFIAELLRTAFENQDSMLSLNDLATKIRLIGVNWGFSSKANWNDLNPIQILIDHGQWLQKEYGIRQFLLLRKSEAPQSRN